jgi:hypothetical protein
MRLWNRIWWLVTFGTWFDCNTHEVRRSLHHRVRRVNRSNAIARRASLMGAKAHSRSRRSVLQACTHRMVATQSIQTRQNTCARVSHVHFQSPECPRRVIGIVPRVGEDEEPYLVGSGFAAPLRRNSARGSRSLLTTKQTAEQCAQRAA